MAGLFVDLVEADLLGFVFIVLVCAYAGSLGAGAQFSDIPGPYQAAQK